MKKIDLDVLKRLYSINSKSGNEDDIRDEIVAQAAKVDPDAKIDIDAKGNMMIVKGKDKPYPCVLAHMDEVHAECKDIQIVQTGKFLYGWSDFKRGMAGIGADDKNGIYVCLRALEDLPSVKLIFTVGEEIGGTGSNALHIDRWLSDVRYVIQCDRRNGSDFITNISGDHIASSDFKKAAGEILKRYGYKKEVGLFTDVVVLKRRGLKVSACNLSCGYYNPHSAQECTNVEELENCITAVLEICTSLTEVYKHKFEERKWQSPTYWGGKHLDPRDIREIMRDRFKVEDKRVNREAVNSTSINYSPYDCSTCLSMNCWNCPKYSGDYRGHDIY